MRDGLASQCRDCKKIIDAKYRAENPEKIALGKAKCYQENKNSYDKKTREWVHNNPEARKEIASKSYQNNRDSRLSYSAEYRAKNKERYKVWIKEWIERNRDLDRAKHAKRRSAKLSATPGWISKDHLSEIQSFYSMARDCEVVTGEPYHVDHIIPLQGKNICGLHVPWNLQVLPSDINQNKSNKHDSAVYCSTPKGIT
jgi:hypothetical protein